MSERVIKMKGLTLGSLFDGIGGFPFAAQSLGIQTIWTSEINSTCCDITARHFPDAIQLGDVTKINGAKIPPVDIISFGSPCQDLSVAGRRAGIDGERSGLFMEAVRIIYEMREATNGKSPTYIIWENVPGAYSSHGGDDFRRVLQEIAKTEIPMPKCGKWAESGMVRTDGVGIAWRTFDAQHWGVPNVENVSTLSQILETNAPKKYCLSPKACSGILKRAERREKELEPLLNIVLIAQASYPVIAKKQEV